VLMKQDTLLNMFMVRKLPRTIFCGNKFQVIIFLPFSAPEHNVLMVSFFDRLLAVMECVLCGVNICLVNNLEATLIVQTS
jgi:hypothetical protein